MNETRRNLMVGVFALLALAALSVLIILFGESPEVLGGSTYTVTADFESVEGISRGMRVSMSGITIGEIDRIDWVDPQHPENGVEVRLRIFEKYTIPQSAKATVVSSVVGFGNATFRIAFPTGMSAQPVPKDGYGRIVGELVTGNIVPDETLHVLQTTVQHIGTLASALTPVAHDLHEILQKRSIDQIDGQPTTTAAADRLSANLFTAVERLDRALAHWNTVLGDPDVQSNLKEAVDRIATASRDLPVITEQLKELAPKLGELLDDGKTLVARTTEVVDNTDQRIDTLAKKLLAAAEEAERSLHNIRQATQAIADGEGTIGKLVFDERLYEELVLTAGRINEAIKSVVVLVDSLQTAAGP